LVHDDQGSLAVAEGRFEQKCTSSRARPHGPQTPFSSPTWRLRHHRHRLVDVGADGKGSWRYLGSSEGSRRALAADRQRPRQVRPSTEARGDSRAGCRDPAPRINIAMPVVARVRKGTGPGRSSRHRAHGPTFTIPSRRTAPASRRTRRQLGDASTPTGCRAHFRHGAHAP
jgi:hypothetical protein